MVSTEDMCACVNTVIRISFFIVVCPGVGGGGAGGGGCGGGGIFPHVKINSDIPMVWILSTFGAETCALLHSILENF